MMYGTPGGIVLIFGGDVRYLCLAISELFVSEASVPGKILRLSAKRSEQEKPQPRQDYYETRWLEQPKTALGMKSLLFSCSGSARCFFLRSFPTCQRTFPPGFRCLILPLRRIARHRIFSDRWVPSPLASVIF